MARLQLTGITVYPLKSAGGISSETWEVDPFGLRYDRRWMVVDLAGRFLSQREFPRLALVRPVLLPGALSLRAPGFAELRVPLEPLEGPLVPVSVWAGATEARSVGPAAAQWLSRLLGFTCRVVYMPDTVVRPVDPEYGEPGDRVSFTDGFPFLIISEASLEELNRRLARPLPMNRFRPNLVVGGCDPFEEDRWRVVRIGGLELRIVKPCARCVVTTTDQETAERGTEPLRTLATFRNQGGKVLFGQNAIHRGTGRLEVGAPISVLA
jgi:uncharacterized protein YcbX